VARLASRHGVLRSVAQASQTIVHGPLGAAARCTVYVAAIATPRQATSGPTAEVMSGARVGGGKGDAAIPRIL
jgi:hypothetical protein